VAIVGEAPGRNEIERGSPFVGQSGALLRDLLYEAWRTLPVRVPRLRYDDFWITNTVLCKPPSGDIEVFLKSVRDLNKRNMVRWKSAASRAKLALDPLPPKPVPIPSPVECCRPRLLPELRGRSVIVPVGALALRTLDPKKKGIVRWRGAPFEWNLPDEGTEDEGTENAKDIKRS